MDRSPNSAAALTPLCALQLKLVTASVALRVCHCAIDRLISDAPNGMYGCICSARTARSFCRRCTHSDSEPGEWTVGGGRTVEEVTASGHSRSKKESHRRTSDTATLTRWWRIVDSASAEGKAMRRGLYAPNCSSAIRSHLFDPPSGVEWNGMEWAVVADRQRAIQLRYCRATRRAKAASFHNDANAAHDAQAHRAHA